MADFAQALNRDVNLILTSARYDTGASTWLHDTANFAQNAAGVWVPVSPTNPMPTKEQGSSALNVGTFSAGASANPLHADLACAEVLLVADANNAANVLIGNSATQVVPLRPGQSMTVPARNLNLVYAKAASGTATLYWIART